MVARVLTVEDEENLRYSIRQALTKAGHDVSETDNVAAAIQMASEREFDIVLSDINLNGDRDGIELIRQMRADGFTGAAVIMTAYGTVDSAVRAMKDGADDYLQKPLSLEELVLLIERLVEQRKVRTRLKLYERLDTTKSQATGIVGKSEQWLRTLDLADRLATIPITRRLGKSGQRAGGALPTILITGETGTGKGLLARYIHQQAQEGDSGPFVHINCTALPPSLVESELFGHEKGAFTDAKSAREGLFEMADGGTVFLDEIGDMPLDLQGKILNVVEEGTFRRVGGTRDRSVHARIIGATNQDLDKRVEEGRFRRDLLYRLNAFAVTIPPLRERGDDALLIARTMLEKFTREYGRPSISLSDDACRAIAMHPWHGNVRELINVVQRVAMLCDEAEVTAGDLGLDVPPQPSVPVGEGVTCNGAGPIVFDFDAGMHTADEIEKELIVQALQRTRGNVSKAAKLIGMQRSSLRYRIERFDLENFVQELAHK